MARDEEAREDLLREATALVARVELRVAGFEDSIVAGFRSNGAASFFFGQQVVYQFNVAGELRRGFFEGRLYKAECGQLVNLTRRRTAETVDLVRHELNRSETADFLSNARQRLAKLRNALCERRFQIVGQVPANKDITGQVQDWLATLSETISLADTPRVN
jgi:hypothetical protein